MKYLNEILEMSKPVKKRIKYPDRKAILFVIVIAESIGIATRIFVRGSRL